MFIFAQRETDINCCFSSDFTIKNVLSVWAFCILLYGTEPRMSTSKHKRQRVNEQPQTGTVSREHTFSSPVHMLPGIYKTRYFFSIMHMVNRGFSHWNRQLLKTLTKERISENSSFSDFSRQGKQSLCIVMWGSLFSFQISGYLAVFRSLGYLFVWHVCDSLPGTFLAWCWRNYL